MTDEQFTAFFSPIVAWLVDHVWHLLFSLGAGRFALYAIATFGGN
jgi:hypothetical protein